jgi:hypothetical protein
MAAIFSNLDPDAAKNLVQFVAAELDSLAAQVWAFGWVEGARWAVATVSQMGAELAVCAAHLYETERWYSGAALVRQLIEVEYLLFLFASDDKEPERWLRATTSETKQLFSPAAMRKRSGGRFRAEEYAAHCEVGGHPRRQGHHLLGQHLRLATESTAPAVDPGIQWVDLAQHVARLWEHYVNAVIRHSPTNIYPDRFARVDEAIAKWSPTITA